MTGPNRKVWAITIECQSQIDRSFIAVRILRVRSGRSADQQTLWGSARFRDSFCQQMVCVVRSLRSHWCSEPGACDPSQLLGRAGLQTWTRQTVRLTPHQNGRCIRDFCLCSDGRALLCSCYMEPSVRARLLDLSCMFDDAHSRPFIHDGPDDGGSVELSDIRLNRCSTRVLVSPSPDYISPIGSSCP